MKHAFHFAVVLILCAACKKEEPPPAPTEVTVVPPAAEQAKPAAAPAPPVDVETLPVEEDFEVEAEEEVTAASLNEMLDQLEKEIGAE